MSSMKDKDILVIDDMQDVRHLVKKILESDGARVLDAESIDSGLEIALKKAPQLIILDIELPGKTGFDFLLARNNAPTLKDVPTIILSGKKDKATVSQAIAMGANDYVLKPLRATLLLQKTRKALRLASFLSKKFEGKACPEAIFSLSAEITKLSEGGCFIDAPVKIKADETINLTGTFIEKIGLQDNEIKMKASSNPSKYAAIGRYSNEIYFIGMNEERAKKIRSILKDIK